MKYKALGDNVLIEVEKINKNIKKADGTASILVIADTSSERETTSQTVGKLVGIGPLAFRFDDGTPHASLESVKIGDKVHFQRYGAIRLHSQKEDDVEYWVINDKGLLALAEDK